MSASFLEIVELPNGDFALQRIDDDGETLVTISFSSEAKAFLQENNEVVARAMINAGMQVVGAIVENEGNVEIESEESPKILH